MDAPREEAAANTANPSTAAPATTTSPSTGSAGEAQSQARGDDARAPGAVGAKDGKISADDIEMVQGLIEHCLQHYMNQTEIIAALHFQANVEPGLTNLVWNKLEEQNRDFFKCYNLRLRVREQLLAFNVLVDQQLRMQQRAAGTGGDANAGAGNEQMSLMHAALKSPGMAMSPLFNLNSPWGGGSHGTGQVQGATAGPGDGSMPTQPMTSPLPAHFLSHLLPDNLDVSPLKQEDANPNFFK